MRHKMKDEIILEISYKGRKYLNKISENEFFDLSNSMSLQHDLKLFLWLRNNIERSRIGDHFWELLDEYRKNLN